MAIQKLNRLVLFMAKANRVESKYRYTAKKGDPIELKQKKTYSPAKVRVNSIL